MQSETPSLYPWKAVKSARKETKMKTTFGYEVVINNENVKVENFNVVKTDNQILITFTTQDKAIPQISQERKEYWG